MPTWTSLSWLVILRFAFTVYREPHDSRPLCQELSLAIQLISRGVVLLMVCQWHLASLSGRERQGVVLVRASCRCRTLDTAGRRQMPEWMGEFKSPLRHEQVFDLRGRCGAGRC